MTLLNLTPDELLTTTRSVRKRLDFSRPVEPALIRECLELAVQAPTGGNRQTWHFVVVTDAQQRQALVHNHATFSGIGGAPRKFPILMQGVT